jgi:hypothetical protein
MPAPLPQQHELYQCNCQKLLVPPQARGKLSKSNRDFYLQQMLTKRGELHIKRNLQIDPLLTHGNAR